tara:strand:+ start:16805 stop:17377 length:573 start_codon:yes stop_codon:yes gene_type:complete
MIISTLSPLLVAFFMVMVSLMNENIKGIVYLAGALIALGLNYPIQAVIGDQTPENVSLVCSPIDMGMNQYNSPASSSLFLAFTFAYLFIPMYSNSTYNYGIVSSMLILMFGNIYAKTSKKCFDTSAGVMGTLVGFVFGTLWYVMLQASNAQQFLYFGEMDSNAVRCSMPSEQTFRCSMYKNGKLVSSDIA